MSSTTIIALLKNYTKDERRLFMNSNLMANEKYSLKQIQEKLLVILLEFDRICKKNNLKYSLDSGTLLGAIRHNGFIPWDDDVDVVMLRKDYKKFIRACKKDLNHDLFTLETTKTSKYYSYNFGKLKMNNTIYEEKGSSKVKEHKGLFLDIFPLDNTSKITYKIQYKLAYFWQTIRWNKIGREFSTSHKKINSFFGKILPLKLVNFNAEFALRFCNIFPTKNVCKLCHYGKGKKPHSRQFYTNIIEHTFEGEKFFVPKDYETWLNMRYGDWKKLPPIEQQKPGHAIRIEL